MDEKQLVSLLTDFRENIIKAFDQRIGIAEENIQHRLDLVVEGYQMMAQKLEDTGTDLKAEIAKVDRRVTAVSVDLTALRADTEAHHGVYRVREE